MPDKFIPIIADDNGYAYHKLAFWENTPKSSRIMELSFASRAALGAQAMTVDGELTGVYEIDGTRWTVGEHVYDPENTRSGDYGTSNMNAVLIAHALDLAGYGGKEVRLVTGLPYDRFYDQDGVRTEYIQKVKTSLESPVSALGGKPMANITEHRVYPESMAAWFDIAIDAETGDTIAENESGVVVADIGGNTTDLTYITPGNKDINKARSGTREAGVLHVRDKLRHLLMKEFSIDEISEAKLDQALREGTFRIFNDTHDVCELNKEAVNEVSQRILNFMADKIGEGASLDYIVLVGGGAAVMGDCIRERYQHASVPENPQFSNARGMLKHWTFCVG